MKILQIKYSVAAVLFCGVIATVAVLSSSQAGTPVSDNEAATIIGGCPGTTAHACAAPREEQCEYTSRTYYTSGGGGNTKPDSTNLNCGWNGSSECSSCFGKVDCGTGN